MSVDGSVFAIIVAMALITASSRVAGYWLSDRIEFSARLETAMNLVPGTIITAVVAPAVATEGIGGVIAAGVAILIMRKTGNMIVTLVTAVGALVLYRNLI